MAGRHGHAKGIVGLYLDWCCCKHRNELFDDPCIRGSGRCLGHPCCPIHVCNIGKLCSPSFAATLLDADVCSKPVLASAYRTLVAIEFMNVVPLGNKGRDDEIFLSISLTDWVSSLLTRTVQCTQGRVSYIVRLSICCKTLRNFLIEHSP